MNRPRNRNLLQKARNLRKGMTKEERHLWYDFLRYCSPRFRRQEIIGNYIADFYCHEAQLVLELDGSQHLDSKAIEYDARRTSYFQSLGIRVIRFYNSDITQNFEGVCQHILSILDSLSPHPSVAYGDSSPQGEP